MSTKLKEKSSLADTREHSGDRWAVPLGRDSRDDRAASEGTQVQIPALPFSGALCTVFTYGWIMCGLVAHC